MPRASRPHPLTVDVRDLKSVAAMIAETENKFGRLDILVNNAAVGSNIPPVAIEDNITRRPASQAPSNDVSQGRMIPKSMPRT
jgi:NAD(P)-dependent dehydrogenase (short-subunit alcohol dehydrogenase family)